MISKNDVTYIAELSRIHLRDDETESLTKDLEKILHYIEKLEKLDVKEIQPTSHVFPVKNVFRPDKETTPLSQDEALSFAVEKKNGSFKVPKVIE